MKKIKVYIGKTDALCDSSLFERLYRSACKERRCKIDRLKNENAKRLSLGAELLLKKALELEGIVDYTLALGEHGKPYIKGEGSIHFNLSHSGDTVMCAVSDREVGCDVERISDMPRNIAKRFFSQTEYAALEKAENEDARRDMFFRLWTLKESFMKQTGLGMALPLDSFSIGLCGEDIEVLQSVSHERYYFKEYDVGDGYKYAVCGLVPDFSDIRLLSFE